MVEVPHQRRRAEPSSSKTCGAQRREDRMSDGGEGRWDDGLQAPLLPSSRGRETPMPVIIDVESGEGEGEEEAVAPPTPRVERSTDNGDSGSGCTGPSKKQGCDTRGVVLSWGVFSVFVVIDMALWALGLAGPAAVVLLCGVLPAMVAPPALCLRIAKFWCCF